MADQDSQGDGLPPGWSPVRFDEIDSTNSEAMRRAAAGERGPLWLTARSQTQGRGRSGRTWSSEVSGLAATLLFSPGCPMAALAQLSLVSGVAAHAAISAVLPPGHRPRVRIKWPNDVLIDRAKVSGILVETSVFGHHPIAVIGTGINIGSAPDIAGRDTAALRDFGASASFDEMSCRLAGALAQWIGTWDNGHGFSAVRQAWLARAGALGEPMTVNAGGEVVAGRFAGLDGAGGLLLDVGHGALRIFSFGDVALVSPSV